MLYETRVVVNGICRNCGMKVKNGEWYATPYLHLYCCSSKDLRILHEEGEKRFRESIVNQSEGKGMGHHFGSSVDEFCLEM